MVQCISLRTPNLITTSVQLMFISYLFWVLVLISVCTPNLLRVHIENTMMQYMASIYFKGTC